MVKSNYATDTNVYLLLTGVADDISAALMTYSLTTSDNWANALLSAPVSVTSTPALVMQAAEYYSASFILRNLFDVSEVDSGTAIWYEKQATDLLSYYISQNSTEDSEIHPYSGNLTPTNVFMQRNKRTVIDDTDYDNVNDIEWDAEE